DWWKLEVGTFVSPPSSLRLFPPYYIDTPLAVLCRYTPTLTLEQGRILSWMQWLGTTPNNCSLLFRAQAPLGSASINNSYLVGFGYNGKRWRYIDPTGVSTTIASWGGGLDSNTWYRYRITWWNGKNLQNQDACCLRLERWDGAAWVSEGDAYDTNNRNKGSAINRVGLAYWGASGYSVYYDDTEIWGS
ncbi:hypothetical protein KKE60_04955, partial [Patescibacteria group bacterium]|nr:hypothetical protein [Patescibacteria group bacterium]